MKRAISIMLALLMLAFVLVSCGEETPKTQGNATSTATGTVSTEATEEVKIVPDIPDELKFEGQEFVILTLGDNYGEVKGKDFLVTEEAEGELINDKALERINAAQERFGITIVNNISNTVHTDLNNAISSGTFLCDIALPRINDVAGQVQKGNFLDFQTVDHIDLDKPWWDQAIQKNLAFGGKVYFMTGDITISDEETACCIFINKTLAEEKDLPNLYENLENNTWTIDALHEYVKDASQDLDGDGDLDTNDIWGMGSDSSSGFLFLNSSGAAMAELDAEGKPVITLNSARAQEVVEKVISLYNEKEAVIWASTNGGWSVVNGMVVNGQICLIPANIYKFSSYIAMEDDFGVLPIPKLDSDQENYYHQVFTNACAAVYIPNNVENVEKVGAVTEYLAYLGREIMVPAYYDTYLEGRVKRDEETEKSFDIIFSTKYYDLGYAYNWGGISTTVRDAIVNNGGFTSLISSKVDAAQAAANETYDAFVSMFS